MEMREAMQEKVELECFHLLVTILKFYLKASVIEALQITIDSIFECLSVFACHLCEMC